MKNMIVRTLASTLCIALLTGCGANENEQNAQGAGPSDSTVPTVEQSDQISDAKVVPDLIEILGNEEAGGRWSREPVLTDAGTYLFTDVNDDSFEFYNFRFTEIETAEGEVASTDMIVLFTISSVGDAMPLFRIDHRVGEERSIYDAVLDVPNGRVQEKGLLEADHVSFTTAEDGTIEVEMTVSGLDLSGETRLVVASASSASETYGYDRALQGDLDVISIKYVVE